MSIWRYEIEAAVNSRVFDIVSVEPGLVIVELLKLLLHIISNRLPTVHSATVIYIRPMPHENHSFSITVYLHSHNVLHRV